MVRPPICVPLPTVEEAKAVRFPRPVMFWELPVMAPPSVKAGKMSVVPTLLNVPESVPPLETTSEVVDAMLETARLLDVAWLKTASCAARLGVGAPESELGEGGRGAEGGVARDVEVAGGGGAAGDGEAADLRSAAHGGGGEGGEVPEAGDVLGVASDGAPEREGREDERGADVTECARERASVGDDER